MIDEPAEDPALERHARELLADSVARLPAGLRSRLTQARHAALEAHRSRRRHRAQRWVPAGAVVAAVVALMVVFLPHGTPSSGDAVRASIEDIDLLTSDVPLTVQESDFQFYEWAVDEAGTSGGRGANGAAASDGS
jgi:uncharacterized membrane protein